MTKGVLCFAFNNGKVDYIKQAYYLALRVKRHLDLPTSIVTTKKSDIPQNYLDAFDRVIEKEYHSENMKRYYDGNMSHRNLYFNNFGRHNAYELTPYKQTLVMDTDYIICNSILKQAFTQTHDFMIYKDGIDIAGWRHHEEFDYINDKGIPFYWATVFYFEKTENTKNFFNVLGYVVKNYEHFKKVYDIGARNFRNDHAFSIAIHMMNGFEDNTWAKKLPGTMYYMLDQDLIKSIDEDKIEMLVSKVTRHGEYILAGTNKQNVHVMNKFGLERLYD